MCGGSQHPSFLRRQESRDFASSDPRKALDPGFRRDDEWWGGEGRKPQRGCFAMMPCTWRTRFTAWSNGRSHMLRPNITPFAPDCM